MTKASKLTDTQLIILSGASQREDGAAIVPARLNKAAAAKVSGSLIAKKLMREMRAKTGMPVWREKADGQGFALIITKGGRDAIGIEAESTAAAQAQEAVLPPAGRAAALAARARPGPDKAAKTGPAAKNPVKALKAPSNNADLAGRGAPRAGSKQALIVGMLTRDAGATIGDLTKATGWLAHTTRGALTGLRKRGFAIERFAEKGQPGFYKIPFENVPTLIIETGARAE